MLTMEEMRRVMDRYSEEGESCRAVMPDWAPDVVEDLKRRLQAAETREARMRERIALLGLEGMFVPKEDLIPDRKTAAALLRRCTGEELRCGKCPLQGLGDQCCDALKLWSAELLEEKS